MDIDYKTCGNPVTPVIGVVWRGVLFSCSLALTCNHCTVSQVSLLGPLRSFLYRSSSPCVHSSSPPPWYSVTISKILLLQGLCTQYSVTFKGSFTNTQIDCSLQRGLFQPVWTWFTSPPLTFCSLYLMCLSSQCIIHSKWSINNVSDYMNCMNMSFVIFNLVAYLIFYELVFP